MNAQIDLGPSSDLAFGDFGIAMLFSLAMSIVTYILYSQFYGRTHVGAGVDRTFILAGPSITALFISIQFSLPLSLGLLGALSFVRFRTPVKDPAEIGFLLALIASSVGAATYNYDLVAFLYGIALAALVAQHVAAGRWPGRRSRDLVITLHTDDYAEIEERVQAFLDDNLGGLRQQGVSSVGTEVSLHLQFRGGPQAERWGAFARQLNERIAPARAELFVS